MTLDQMVERMPNLQLEDLRFLAGLDTRLIAGRDVFWQLLLENNNEETLTTHIAHCREVLAGWW